MKKPASFLVINPFGIGDVLFSTPLLRNLHETFPQSKIYYLCNKRVYPLLKEHPFLTKVFIYERDDFEAVKKQSRWQWFLKFWNFFKEIRREKIECAIDLSLNTKFGFYALVCGIRERLGLDYKQRGKLLTRKVAISGYNDRHVAESYLSVLELLGISWKPFPLEIFLSKTTRDWAAAFLQQNKITADKRVVAVAPCGGEAFGPNAYMKRWPLDSYVTLIQRMNRETGVVFFLFAGCGEKKEIETILNELGRPSNCFEFTDASIEQLLGLVERADLFIGNDTGPLRFADAFQKKIIAFFGPVDERVYGTYPFEPSRHLLFKKELACRPCYQKFRLPPCPYDLKCLKEITVDEVSAAVEKMLEARKV